MKEKMLSLSCLFLLFSAYCLADNAKMDEKSLESVKRWDTVMKDFRTWDAENTFPQDGILFVGSSSVNLWKTRECFPEMPVINRGFGGSIYSDIIYWSDTVIKPYDPKVIVFYSGDNDPYWGKAPERILEDFKELCQLVDDTCTDASIVAMGPKLCWSRIDKRDTYMEINRLLEDFADTREDIYYFDTVSPLLDEDGDPDPSLFRDDRLHLNDEGYAIWSDKIRPLLKDLLGR
jgi:lysophospholipase L1-like esterase